MPELKVLLAGADERDLTKLAEYRAIGGYDAVPKARAMSSDELIEALSTSKLRGRGGAGFPTGRKASLIDRKSAKPKYLVVNADESEPGAFKDREVLARVPHRLIEGCLIAAHAIESTDVFIYIRGEYLAEWEILQAAVDEARAAGLFGDVEITVHRGAGAYICGEETALLDSLEGRRGLPRPRPPFPPIQGLYNAPTQINNVCTIATMPTIINMGAGEFAKVGAESAPGTAIFSISGNVVRPGNYELVMGTPMRELIYDHAGGIAGGRELKAWCSSRCGQPSSTCTSPAGSARHVARERAGWCSSSSGSRPARERCPTSTCSAPSVRGSSAARSAHSATLRSIRCAATCSTGAPSSRRTSSRAAVRFAASPRSKGSSPRAMPTAT